MSKISLKKRRFEIRRKQKKREKIKKLKIKYLKAKTEEEREKILEKVKKLLYPIEEFLKNLR